MRERGDVRQVLAQRAAAGHVEGLHPVADAEHGEVALACAGEQRELVARAVGVDVRAELRVGRLAVENRVEVRAAAEHQAVHAVEQGVGVVDEAVGREHDRDATGFLHGLRVAQRQREPVRRQVPLDAAGGRRPGGPRGGTQLMRDDADQRRARGCPARRGGPPRGPRAQRHDGTFRAPRGLVAQRRGGAVRAARGRLAQQHDRVARVAAAGGRRSVGACRSDDV